MAAVKTDEPYELREARLAKRERAVREAVERIDVALTRFEAAPGLPPLDEGPRPALSLVSEKGGDDA